MPVINPAAAAPIPQEGEGVPCGWSINTSCCPTWSTYTVEVRNQATIWATSILHALSGRQFGACPVTIRPCGPRDNPSGGWMAYPVTTDGAYTGMGWPASLLSPYVLDGVWHNCACAGACCCRATAEAWLPGPVDSVTEVRVDGVILDPSTYRVDNDTWLVRTDGGRWPECQDLDTSDPAAAGTFFVTYLRGKALPLAGTLAAGQLACEYAKACSGADCRLPAQLTSLARQGVEITLPDTTALLNAGLTGVADVDLWLRSVNPDCKTHRSRVYSPDIVYARQRTA